MTSLANKFKHNDVKPPIDKSAAQPSKITPRIRERWAISWIYCHGYATAEVLKRVTRREKTGSENHLVKKGFLLRTRTTVENISEYFFTLSEEGVRIAEQYHRAKTTYKYLNPNKISQSIFRHNIIGQQITLDLLFERSAKNYISPAILKKKYPTGEKIPDAAVIDDDGNLIAVEIELNQKWGRYLDQMVFQIHEALKEKKYAGFVIYSSSPATLKNYAAAMAAGATAREWRYPIMREFSIPDWMPEKLQFRLIDKKYL